MNRVIGSIDSHDRNVTIWGAGFSGLVLGHYLKSAGYRVTILERDEKIGGKIQTETINGATVERAANALYLNKDGLDLIRELKLEPILATRKLRRLLMVEDIPRSIPAFFFLKKLPQLRKRPPLITEGLSVAEFLRPLLGQDGLDKIVSPALGGIYAAPAEQLHFKSVFSHIGDKAQFKSYWEFFLHLRKIRQQTPPPELKGSVSFEGGMKTLIAKLGENLRNEIKTGYKGEFKLTGNTIICTDALSASELLKVTRPEMSAILERIRYQRLSSITTHLKTEIRSLRGAFGVLIPPGGKYISSGILNNRAIFPANNPNTLSYTLIARQEMTDDQVFQELKHLAPQLLQEDIEHLERSDWPRAIPLYDLQRFLSVKRLHQLASEEKNLAIFGNYVAGISLREMVTAAKVFAREHARSGK